MESGTFIEPRKGRNIVVAREIFVKFRIISWLRKNLLKKVGTSCEIRNVEVVSLQQETDLLNPPA